MLTRGLVEETHTHVTIGLLLGLLGSSLSGGTGRRGSSSGSRSSSSVSLRVSNAVLDRLRALEGVLGGNGKSKNVLVVVDDGVGDSGESGVADGQRDGGNGLKSREEVANKLVISNVEDGRSKDLTLVVDALNGNTVSEGRDVKHVKKGSLGGTNLLTSSNNLDVVGDLNGTTGNLGGNTKSLEERGLTRLHTGVTGRDPNVLRSNGTSTGRSGNLVVKENITDGLQVLVGENESNVTLDQRKEAVKLGDLRDESAEGTSNHGVLTHENDGTSTESLSDLVHLLGRDIVDTNKEDALVVLKKSTELGEVFDFLSGSASHFDYL